MVALEAFKTMRLFSIAAFIISALCFATAADSAGIEAAKIFLHNSSDVPVRLYLRYQHHLNAVACLVVGAHRTWSTGTDYKGPGREFEITPFAKGSKTCTGREGRYLTTWPPPGENNFHYEVTGSNGSYQVVRQ